MEEIIYFEINNWFVRRDYPDTPFFISALKNDLKQKFLNEKWIKENKLCVLHTVVDLSHNYCVTATKSWVENKCPELLTEKYNNFLRYPEEDCELPDANLAGYFLVYKEENIGLFHHIEEYDYGDDEDDDEE